MVFKLYDSLSSFSCPSSYVMGKAWLKEAFCSRKIGIYTVVLCFVRPNIMNHGQICWLLYPLWNMVYILQIYGDSWWLHQEGGQCCGKDWMSGKTFLIFAVLFTVILHWMQTRAVFPCKDMKKCMAAASGTHMVLLDPQNMGLLNYSTSDGWFLFCHHWEGHTLVWAMDKHYNAEMLPNMSEDKIKWILNECGSYFTWLAWYRSEVLSAWRGWRLLAVDHMLLQEHLWVGTKCSPWDGYHVHCRGQVDNLERNGTGCDW